MTLPNLQDVATRHQVHLERVKAGYLKDFEKFLQRIAKDITRILNTPSMDLTDFSVGRLESTLLQVQKAIEAVFVDYRAVYFETLNALAQYEAEFEWRNLDQRTIKVDFILPSPDQVRSAVLNAPLSVRGVDGGSLLEPLFSRWSEKTILRIDGAIRMGFVQGETTFKVLQRIRGTKAAGYRDGLLKVTDNDIKALVRTGLQHAAMQARQAVWDRNSDIVPSVQWVATLDNRTTIQCQSLDGHQFPRDKGPRPPIHINCRSSVVAVLDKRFAALSEDQTRSARGESGKAGQVSAKESYYSWLKKQPAAFQDSALGPTRAKLLRDGGLSADEFAKLQLDKSFQPLTLEEMRKLEPTAFEKAGI